MRFSKITERFRVVKKLLDGTLVPDRGSIARQSGVTIARLEQEVPERLQGTIFDVVAAGLGDAGRLLARYHEASHRVGAHGSEAALRELDRLHSALDAAGAWHTNSQVESILLHLGLDADAPFATASGGRKRQALLARAFVSQPDVLLLDEPTNHLDIDAVEWMEDFLVESGMTLLFVTTIAFLRRVATRIVDLDRASWWTGAAITTYLERKEAALAVEEREWALFDETGAGRDRSGRASRHVAPAMRGGCAGARGAAGGARGAARPGGHGAPAGPGGGAVRAPGGGGATGEFRAGRTADRARFHDHDLARRPRGTDRPQRFGQDHPAPPAARRAAPDSGASARAPVSRSRTSTSCGSSWIPT
jgi:hypothetical protein